MTPIDLPSLIAGLAAQRRLRPRDDVGEIGWKFWELRNLNRHRIVGFVHEHRTFADVHDLEVETRTVVARHFECAWWRGLGFGVVADVPSIDLKTDDLRQLVDVRANDRGTLQWCILVAGESRAAIGVHTWAEVDISPVYRGILHELGNNGYHVARGIREKDGLLRFVTAVANLDVTIQSFGTRRVFIPEFHDEP